MEEILLYCKHDKSKYNLEATVVMLKSCGCGIASLPNKKFIYLYLAEQMWLSQNLFLEANGKISWYQPEPTGHYCQMWINF